MGAGEAPTSDDKDDLSPKAREGSFDTTCPLTPRKLSLPELSPEAPSVPAATATDIIEVVPRYFDYNTVTDEYKIYWKFAGALDHRFFARQGPVDVSCHDVPHGKHDDIPMDVSAVVTRLVKPLIYPIGCPRITPELLRRRELQGPQWLKHGRVAFIDGLLDGTIPRNCTTKPFKSTKLGLYYEAGCAAALGLETLHVLIDEETGSVKRVQTDSEINSDDSDNEWYDRSKARFNVYDVCHRKRFFDPIVHSRRKALAWDQRMKENKLPPPSGALPDFSDPAVTAARRNRKPTPPQDDFELPLEDWFQEEPEEPAECSFAHHAAAVLANIDLPAQQLNPDTDDELGPAATAPVVIEPPWPPLAQPTISQGDNNQFVVSGDIVAGDEDKHDWTDVADAALWQFLTTQRYETMKYCLLDDQSVQFRVSGDSLAPIVNNGETCVIEPIATGCNSQILTGDIVFCAVQPGDRYYVHLVWRTYEYQTEFGTTRTLYVIGNTKEDGRQKRNGWCYREHLFGILQKTQIEE